MQLEAILSAFEEALELERELGTRTVELDRALLRKPSPKDLSSPNGDTALTAVKALNALNALNAFNALNGDNAGNADNAFKNGDEAGAVIPDFAFLLECEPSGQVAELLPKMSEAIGYGRDGVRVNDPNARVLIVLGADALRKWLPGVLARPGQWVKRGETPALVTASPTKTYRFFGNDPDKIRKLKLRLWADLKTALARIGKTPPARQNGKR